MRHALPLAMILLVALVIASILLPADPWTHYFAFRALAILAIGVPCYLLGFSRGKEETQRPAGKRRWTQFSLRALFLVTTLVAILLALYCGRVRRQREAVAALQDIEFCFVNYDVTPDNPVLDLNVERSWLAARMEELLGFDFLHRATRVELSASDAVTALPHLRRLPNLLWVSVQRDEIITTQYETPVDLERSQAKRRKIQLDAIERLKRELPYVEVNDRAVPFPPIVG